MDKVTAFMEKNVEWIAMGLGGLFLLFVAWNYGVSNPVPVEIDGKPYSAASVDKKVEERARQLEEKLAHRTPLKIPVVNVADQFSQAFNPTNPAADQRWVMDFKPIRTEAPQIDPAIPDPVHVGKVKELPTVPKTELEEVRTGQSLVALPENPDAAAAQQAAVQPAGGGNLPVRAVPQPVNAGVPAQIPGMDRTWITVFGKFNDAELTKSFNAVGIPHFAQTHVFIQVQLERREVKGPNSYGQPELVPELPHNQLPVPRNQAMQFIQLAMNEVHLRNILQPSFYMWIAGTRWEVPGQEVVVVDEGPKGDQFIDPATGRFDAVAAAQHMMQLLTVAEQRKFQDSVPQKFKGQLYAEVQKLKQEQQRQNAPQREGVNPRPGANPRGGGYGPGGGRGGREGPYMAQDPSILEEMYASGSSDRRDPRYFPRPGAMGNRNPRLMREDEGVGRGQDAMPWAQQVGEFGLNPDGTIDVWQHDETAQPGKTYQYRIRVVIKNPLFGFNNIAENPALEKEPYLTDPAIAPWSQWSKNVVIPPDLKMQFVAGVMQGSGVRVNIRRFQKGQFQITPQAISAEPGDVIGAKVGDVDYTTTWTLVDVRKVGNDTRVRIIDKDGNMVIRSTREDQFDPDFVRQPVPVLNPDAVGGANGALINPLR